MSDLGFSFNDEEIEALQMFLDVDSSGSLSFDEFYQYWITIASTDELETLMHRLELMKYAANMFKMYDTDHDRVLSIDDFGRFYRALYETQKDAGMQEITEAMKQLDTNGDGVVSFQFGSNGSKCLSLLKTVDPTMLLCHQ